MFIMKRKLSVCLAMLFACVSLLAQTVQISGTVKDQTGEPVIGVGVIESGTNNGASTDLDGRFTLTVRGGGELLSRFPLSVTKITRLR